MARAHSISTKQPANKRMQSDVAFGHAADAKRYAHLERPSKWN